MRRRAIIDSYSTKRSTKMYVKILIYNQKTVKDVAMLKLAHWFKDVENAGFKSFNTLVRTITQHYNDILNYFRALLTFLIKGVVGRPSCAIVSSAILATICSRLRVLYKSMYMV